MACRVGPHGCDRVESGVDPDQSEDAASRLVHDAHPEAEGRDDGQDLETRPALEVQGAEDRAVDQGRRPGAEAVAQRPVEEAAEEDLFGHGRHDDHRERDRQRRDDVGAAAQVLDVRLVDSEQLEVPQLKPEDRERGARPITRSA